MPDENNEKGTVGQVVQAISAIVEKVPIYQDTIQPAAKEVGKGLEVVAKAVNAALIPVEGLIWGVEKIRDFVRESVAKKLEGVPPEDIQQPNPHIGVPTIEALRYTGVESSLSELYANLLATSMDKDTAYRAHPGFVDMVKNMSPDEARIMRHLSNVGAYPLINIWHASKKESKYRVIHRSISLLGIEAGCEHPLLAPTYLDNLVRLGLIHIDEKAKMADEKLYKRIEEHPDVEKIVDVLNKKDKNWEVRLVRIRLMVTSLGILFIRACVIDKEAQSRS